MEPVNPHRHHRHDRPRHHRAVPERALRWCYRCLVYSIYAATLFLLVVQCGVQLSFNAIYPTVLLLLVLPTAVLEFVAYTRTSFTPSPVVVTAVGTPPHPQVPPNGALCEVCNAPKPPRAHHCRHCNRCIAKMDHHCVWIANCVGYKNHKFFILFLLYTVTTHSLFALLAVAQAGFLLVAPNVPVEARVVGLLADALQVGCTAFALFCSSGMLCRQVYNVLWNETIVESKEVGGCGAHT